MVFTNSTAIFFLLLTMVAGALMPIQMGANATVGQHVRTPYEATFVNFAGGVIVLLVLLAILGRPIPTPWNVPAAPWWSWIGGIIGVIMVTISVISRRELGATTFFAAILAGQIFSSLVLDHYGWLGFTVRSISMPRLIGAALVLVGVYLTTWKSSPAVAKEMAPLPSVVENLEENDEQAPQ